MTGWAQRDAEEREDEAARQERDARRLEVAQRMADALRELADDIADRFDMDSPSTNPGMKSAVKEARAAHAEWEATR